MRVRSGAQLVRLRPDQDARAQPHGRRRGRQARLLPREALHLKRKLQAASYEQKAVEWDSDFDSDASEDEDLKEENLKV